MSELSTRQKREGREYMDQYLIDTDILVDLLKEKFKIQDKIESVGVDNCFVSEITIAELFFGSEKSENLKYTNDADEVMDTFTIVPIFEALRLYGRERARLERQGTPIQDFDLLTHRCFVCSPQHDSSNR